MKKENEPKYVAPKVKVARVILEGAFTASSTKLKVDFDVDMEDWDSGANQSGWDGETWISI
ncbi:MAG: hypothetical protein LBH19_07190 [Dysgonamonadaceae bacterium]|jgi:hypothetical protein|nr:hypothetical protein [Dysgonamonadaceae bacterium]